MDQDVVIEVGREALFLVVALAGPLLISALLVGLLVGVFQAATQIQEQTLSFIPKLLALVVALVVLGPWLLNYWLVFTESLFYRIPDLIG